MPTTTFPFTTESNYTLSNAQISGGFGKTALVDDTGQTLTEDFTDNTGFTYDNTKAEFSGGLLRAKDQRATGALFAANYNLGFDSNWNNSGTTVTPSQVGTPTLVSNRLSCLGGGNNGLVYSASSLSTLGNKGAIKFKYKPGYTTPIAGNVATLAMIPTSGNANRLVLRHNTASEHILIDLFDSSGVAVASVGASSGDFGIWAVTSGTEYEVEFNWDGDAGTIYFLVNGVLIGSKTPGAFTRTGTATQVYVGANLTYTAANAEFDDLIIFNTIQHTAGYTPGYSVADYVYLESKATLPSDTGTYTKAVGTFQLLTNLAVTEVGAPKYIIEGQYWNGSAWAASSGVYAQANSLSTILTNLATLDVSGQSEITREVVFPGSNTLASVDNMILTYTGQHYPAYGTAITLNTFVAKDFSALFDVVTGSVPAGTSLVFCPVVNGVDKYWTGSVWATADGTPSQANTAVEMATNLPTLLSENSTIAFKIFFVTTDDEETAEIDSISVTYDFGALEPASPTQSQVYGYLKDAENNPLVGATVTVTPNKLLTQYAEAADRVIYGSISKTTDANGFFSFYLISSDDFEGSVSNYLLSITPDGASEPIQFNGTSFITFSVPTSASVNITDQITAA